MRKYLIGLAALIALACSGCSKDVGGDLYNLEHYGNVQPQKFQFQGITWGVLDKPEEGRMIVVSLAAHLPLTDAKTKQTGDAAHEYLGRSKRDCTVHSVRLASRTDGSYEFYYSCKK